MEKIRIYLGDWLKNVAIVGLVKLLDKNRKINEKISYGYNYIEFDSSILNGIEEVYFRTLIEENEKNISWYKLISKEDEIKNLSSKDYENSDIELTNRIIEEFSTKLTSNSYTNGYLLLDDSEKIKTICKQLTKIKAKKTDNNEIIKIQIVNQCEYLIDAIEYLKQPKVKRVIAAKNVMYEIIQSFWTNVSILGKSNNKDDMYVRFKEDFIDTMLDYMSKDKSKYKYNCFTCSNKISKLSKPEAYNLSWLVKIGVDKDKKPSHFWNLNSDAYICPVCNLLYSCIPLGFISVKGKGIFINNNISAQALKNSNSVKYKDEEEVFERIEQLSYLNIANSMEQYDIENFDKHFENIQIVKVDASNTARPYSFNILSKKMIYYIYKNKDILNKLIKIRIQVAKKYYINLYDEVISRLYEGKNLFELIAKLLYLQLNEKFNGINYIYNILEINNYVIGGIEMKYKETEEMKYYGIKLRKAYVDKKCESKLSGITYRLLNALKTKDCYKFMDTLINSYMYMKSEIPTTFSKSLTNQDLFQAYGYAFLIGLQGEMENKKNDEREEGK